MLTTEQMQTILKEAMLGKSSSVAGEDADKFRVAMDQDVAESKKTGVILEIYPEWPDIT